MDKLDLIMLVEGKKNIDEDFVENLEVIEEALFTRKCLRLLR